MARFLTSARTVDMLGRQQIAGIPTAVSELFKNSYDAYATAVRADYFPDRRVLLLRDNGIGMSEADFYARWLTIGTDSKTRGSRTPPPKRPDGSAPRRQMGEKGIGRLAIASIGPQLIVVTRARADSTEGSYVIAYVQWSMFELPGLTLDDIVVPVRTVNSEDQVTKMLLDDMRSELLTCVNGLSGAVDADLLRAVAIEIEQMDVDIRSYLSLAGPKILDGHGTAFIVTPVREELDSALEPPDTRDEVSVPPFQRFLSGFSNTMIPDRPPPPLATRFAIHTGETVRDIIDPDLFWRPEDFLLTDHTIEGDFDELGAFHGTISIYGRDPVQVHEPWVGGRGSSTRCGPFKLKFGYVQGQATNSRLSPDEFALMTAKLQRLGGLYIYRDGIRVLPYGNADADYLEIERRRTLNAGRYYFSYRRMFGAIELDSDLNPGLQEKAGREGFRDNGAYKDFTDILKDFFVQIAATYFSSKGAASEEWRTERARLKKRASARAQKEKVEAAEREAFMGQVESILADIETGNFRTMCDAIVAGVESDLATLTAEVSSDRLIAIDARARNELRAFDRRLALKRPAALALTAEEEREWLSLQRMVGLAREQLHSAESAVSALVSASATKVQASQDLLAGARVQEFVGLSSALGSDVAAAAERTNLAAQALPGRVAAIVQDHLDEFSAVQAEAGVASLRSQHADEVGALLSSLADTAALHIESMRVVSERLSRAVDDLDGEDLLDSRMLREQILDLQQQIDQNLEIMQLGQAVQVVSHEFEASIRAVRSGLQKLTPWARRTPRLEPIVRDLRASFAHLDGYLRLFTPLQRRLYRQAVTISGTEIAEFVEGVFTDRLARAEVTLLTTEAFRKWRIRGYPSTFYPVFINLVDNCIYWASTGQGPGQVVLDADDQAMYVRDNGPGIRPRDQEAIFERGFSRRRGGRGLGLALAREILTREGWSLTLDPDHEAGASFRIAPTED